MVKSRTSGDTSDLSRRLDTTGVLLICLMFLLFASTFIAAKYGLRGLPPFTLGAIRTGLAAAILLSACFALRAKVPRAPRLWLAAGMLGLFTTAAPATLGFWGVQHTEASVASVVMATQPFLVAMLAHYLLPGDRLTVLKVVGLTVGFAGVSLISLDKIGLDVRLSLLGQGAIFLNALAAAFSAVVGKSLSRHWQPLPLSAAQTLGGFVVVLAVAVVAESGVPREFTAENLAAATYLAVFPTVGGYTLWFYLLGRHSASRVSSFGFAQPVFGIILGWMILSEGFTWLTICGAALVSWGILTVNRARAR